MTIKILHFPTTRSTASSNMPKTLNGITIAYEEQDINKLSFSIARCSLKEAYCRKTGREEAIKQFMEGNKITLRFRPNSRKNFKAVEAIRAFFKTIIYGIETYSK